MNGHLILDTPIAVDFWNIRKCASVRLFFLSHIHSDHTVGLTSSWSCPIYCSKVTGELLCEKISLPDDLIRPLELNSPTLIPMNPSHTEMLTVTAIDANHCPGAVMFLFQGYFGTILYTGDFRYTPQMFVNSPLGNIFVDVLYLDNTYCDPLCDFASREEVTEKIFEIIQSYPEHDILFGMQSLGKPDLLVAIAKHFQEYIAIPPSMYRFLEILEVPNVFQIDTPEHECRLRVVPSYYISKKLFTKLTRPTIVILVTALYEGLEGTPYSNQDSVYVVPYSDHSSYGELQDFVKRIQPARIIPIIGTKAKGPFNISFAKRADMSCFDQFLLKKSHKPFTVSADVDMKEPRTVCHSNVILSISKKPRRSISMISTKLVKPKGVVFESPPRKNWNNNKNVQKNIPENQDDYMDLSRSPQKEAIDLSVTIPVSKNFPQREAVSDGESETTTNLEMHWRQPFKKRKLILDSHSDRTLNPETCTEASTANSNPDLGSRTNKPNLGSRTNKANLDPDSDPNESILISDSCSGESTSKISQRADLEILDNNIVAENYSDFSTMLNGSESESDCQVQEKTSDSHPSLPIRVQKSTRNSEEKENAEKDTSSISSSKISTVYNIQTNFPVVKLKETSMDPEISMEQKNLPRKRKLPEMFHEDFHSFKKRQCCDYLKSNTKRKQEKSGLFNNQIQKRVTNLGSGNKVNTDVTSRTSSVLNAGHLSVTSEIRRVQSSVFSSSISDYVSQFDTPSWTFLSCQAIFSNFVGKQRLRYKSETSAMSSEIS